MVACLKHYAGYGGVAAGLDYSATDVSEASQTIVVLKSTCTPGERMRERGAEGGSERERECVCVSAA